MEKDTKNIKNQEQPDETGGVQMEGHILIRDVTDDKNPVEIINKRNAIHFGNMAHFLAQCLSGKANYDIHYMAFGNGGLNILQVEYICVHNSLFLLVVWAERYAPPIVG